MAGILGWRPIVAIHPRAWPFAARLLRSERDTQLNPTPMRRPLCRNVSGALQAKPRYKLTTWTTRERYLAALKWPHRRHPRRNHRGGAASPPEYCNVQKQHP